MPIETKTGLSLSDFQEFRKEVFDNGTFKYALIKYKDTIAMINSEQLYGFFKNATVVPGSVSIVYDDIIKYQRDENQQFVLDAKGERITYKNGKQGWTVTEAKSLEQLQNESKTRMAVENLGDQEKTARLSAKTQYLKALKDAEEYLDMTPETIKTIEDAMAGM